MAKKYDLRLQGFVGGWDFDSSYVDYVLEKFSDREVSVLIDSLGGRTDTALSICAAFVDHGNVTVHFRGANASAATIASMGAKRITIEDSATYLVHKCSLEFFDWSMKNADQLESYIEQLKAHKEDLDKIDAHIAELYARRCKKPAKDLLALMKKGGWLTPAEAKKWGFVDDVVTGEKKKPVHYTSYMVAALKEEGIPIPPGATFDDDEQKPDGLVESIVNKVSNLLKHSKMDPEKKTEEGKKTPENKVDKTSPEDKDIEALKAELEEERKKHKEEIDELNSKIATLSKEPGEKSSKVLENSKKDDKPESNPTFKSFMETSSSAKKLFDSIP